MKFKITTIHLFIYLLICINSLAMTFNIEYAMYYKNFAGGKICHVIICNESYNKVLKSICNRNYKKVIKFIHIFF